MADELLTARGVRKSYGRTEALRGVGLEVGDGEVVAVTGPSGSGTVGSRWTTRSRWATTAPLAESAGAGSPRHENASSTGSRPAAARNACSGCPAGVTTAATTITSAAIQSGSQRRATRRRETARPNS